ncbi:hypothetical protein EW026_g2683 [Hermanssonia centrifuga]|uniref:Peptidase A1 domain-containing protein n=1 Tax=Hermanssonia centrifuga TaxID=98765 RepID=A0A4S4KMG9_9APHY|nr:hypothetical protein EW026_g2683 [Hermanssonia centrifuga]
MFSSASLVLILAITAAASPVVVRDNFVRLPFARRLKLTGTASLLELDQSRARSLKTQLRNKFNHKQLKNLLTASTFPVPVTNGVVSYTVGVEVGSPPTTYTLIVDTGSSNTWVGADPSNPYVQTSTSIDTGEEVFVEYGSGLFIGEEFMDTITVGNLTISNQSIGASELAFGFDGVDGILGLGPTDLTEGTTDDGGEVPTVTDNALTLGLIGTNQVGISFEPTTSISDVNGEIIFGGTDSSKHTGDIQFVPITSTSPASDYVGIDQTITYGTSKTPILSATAGITDTGTTLLLIASDALARYQTATGAVSDEDTGLLKITSAQYANLQSLFFQIGSETFEFTANAQIFPRALNTAIGGDANSIYLIVGDLGSDSGEGLDFINGMSFLERFYTVFDSSNAQFGIATTSFTTATSN